MRRVDGRLAPGIGASINEGETVVFDVESSVLVNAVRIGGAVDAERFATDDGGVVKRD